MCTRPMVAYTDGTLTENFKKKLHFPKGFTFDSTPGSFDKIKSQLQDTVFNLEEVLLIPCGQCMDCRINYSRTWATRCLLEAKYSTDVYFVTCTYDNEHLPVIPRIDYTSINEKTGEVNSDGICATLRLEDHQNFMKRLRRYYDYHYGIDNIRFYMCGEYGSKSWRPHYHYIMFNLPIEDLEIYSKARRASDGYYYQSDILSQIWDNGMVRIANVNWNTCAYVARYMTKKHKGLDSDFYSRNGLYPEFSCVSRKPGIGYLYYDEHKDKIYSYDEIIISGRDGKPQKVKPPSYYDALYDIEEPEKMADIKAKRRADAERIQKDILSRTNKSFEDYLITVKEPNQAFKYGKLIRQL